MKKKELVPSANTVMAATLSNTITIEMVDDLIQQMKDVAECQRMWWMEGSPGAKQVTQNTYITNWNGIKILKDPYILDPEPEPNHKELNQMCADSAIEAINEERKNTQAKKAKAVSPPIVVSSYTRVTAKNDADVVLQMQRRILDLEAAILQVLASGNISGLQSALGTPKGDK